MPGALVPVDPERVKTVEHRAAIGDVAELALRLQVGDADPEVDVPTHLAHQVGLRLCLGLGQAATELRTGLVWGEVMLSQSRSISDNNRSGNSKSKDCDYVYSVIKHQ